MDLPTIQAQIASFVGEHDLTTTPESRLFDLTAEIGVLAKEVLKGSSYGKVPFQPTVTWSVEVGDCLFALVCLANATGVDLEAALTNVLDKYRRRLAQNGDAGSGR